MGKSTFIRFGLQNLIAKHDSNRPGKERKKRILLLLNPIMTEFAKLLVSLHKKKTRSSVPPYKDPD